MTDPEIIKYIDQYCEKAGDIEVKDIKENGTYVLIVPVFNGEQGEEQIATLHLEFSFDGDDVTLYNLPKRLLSSEDYISICESIEYFLFYEMPFDKDQLDDVFTFGTDSITWAYYNPDACCGGQFVELTIPYDIVLSTAANYNQPQEFFDALLQTSGTQYLIDRGTAEFFAYANDLKRCNLKGCTQSTMEALISRSKKHTKPGLDGQIRLAASRTEQAQPASNEKIKRSEVHGKE